MKNFNELNCVDALVIKKIIDYTEKKIQNWYYHAKLDYNVKGGVNSIIYAEKHFKITVEENGKKIKYEQFFDLSYFKNQKINYLFDCWSCFMGSLDDESQ